MIKNIVESLQKLGIPLIDTEYRSYIDEWCEWYRGSVEKFHHYNVFNGIQRIGCTRSSLGMAKTVCEDWANLLLNERVQIAVDDDSKQELIDNVLRHERFIVEGNRTIESAFATGTGAFSEYIDADGNVRIDYHDARSIYPLAWEKHKITECAFSSVEVRDGAKCLYLRMYRWNDNGTMHISNRWLDYESGDILPAPEGVLAEIDTGMRCTLFQIITPNIANNIDTTSPLGISVFANAIDALKGVDIAFDSFTNEYVLGRKRLLVPMSMIKLEQIKDGEKQPIFDPNDLVYTVYEAGDDDVKTFTDLSPEIRSDAHITGLRTQLNLLSFKCGLGTGRYEFDKASGVKTATEVISEHSELYQSVCKHELVLEVALRNLVNAILEMSGVNTDTEVTITFDDSIIQDKNSIRTEARDEVAQGLMSKYRYLTEYKGLGEDAAKEELAHIASESRVDTGAISWFEKEDDSE